MKTYQAQSLIHGYRLGRQFAGFMYVAVPEKYKEFGDVKVLYAGSEMILRNFPDGAVYYEEQPDKYHGGKFLLAYFVWGGIKNTKLEQAAEKPEPEAPLVFGIGKEPNVLVNCPDCGSGMFQYFQNKSGIIQCVNAGCAKILGK